jgi:single-strand DNA-binding protein
MNSVHIIGNLGADPEIRATNSGTSVANLRVAVNGRRKVGDQWEDETTWLTVTAFGREADNIGKYLSKGRKVAVEGRISVRQYEDKDGNRRTATEIVAHRVHFLGGQSEGGQRNDRAPAGGGGGGGDDIPFAPVDGRLS